MSLTGFEITQPKQAKVLQLNIGKPALS